MTSHQSGLLTRSVPHRWVLPHVTQLATPTDGITSIRVANSDCSTSLGPATLFHIAGSCHTSPNSPHRLMASHQSGLLTRTVPHRWLLPHITQLATPTDGITSIRVANSECSTSLAPATRHPTRHTD
ncbi:hypothetical protein J6590_071000 [Homalodisca vitripennis]|nr:hypothetical protein J6590_071000 [Homalodisca vitripennis]